MSETNEDKIAEVETEVTDETNDKETEQNLTKQENLTKQQNLTNEQSLTNEENLTSKLILTTEQNLLKEQNLKDNTKVSSTISRTNKNKFLRIKRRLNIKIQEAETNDDTTNKNSLRRSVRNRKMTKLLKVESKWKSQKATYLKSYPKTRAKPPSMKIKKEYKNFVIKNEPFYEDEDEPQNTQMTAETRKYSFVKQENSVFIKSELGIEPVEPFFREPEITENYHEPIISPDLPTTKNESLQQNEENYEPLDIKPIILPVLPTSNDPNEENCRPLEFKPIILPSSLPTSNDQNEENCRSLGFKPIILPALPTSNDQNEENCRSLDFKPIILPALPTSNDQNESYQPMDFKPITLPVLPTSGENYEPVDIKPIILPVLPTEKINKSLNYEPADVIPILGILSTSDQKVGNRESRIRLVKSAFLGLKSNENKPIAQSSKIKDPSANPLTNPLANPLADSLADSLADPLALNQCLKCGEVFAKNFELLGHVQENLCNNFICETCGRGFSKIQHLKTHELTHGEKTQCGICKKTFINKRIQVDKNFVPLDEKLRKSPVCDMCRKASALFGKNRSKCRLYACRYCDKTFVLKSNLTSHVMEHEGTPHVCPICGANFMLVHDFTNHMVSHAREKKFECELCSRSFTQESTLVKHMEQHNQGFNCSFCGKAFYGKYDLNLHEISHIDVKLHKCEICFKGFTMKNLLEKHMLVHQGVRSFKCVFCSKSYFDEGTLKRHIEKYHPDEVSDTSNSASSANLVTNNSDSHNSNSNYSDSHNSNSNYSDSVNSNSNFVGFVGNSDSHLVVNTGLPVMHNGYEF